MREAQKKKLTKRKAPRDVGLRAPRPRQRCFLEKAPLETEKHGRRGLPV